MALKKVNSDWLDSNLNAIASALENKGIPGPNPESDYAYRFTESVNDMAEAINDITTRTSLSQTGTSLGGLLVRASAGYYPTAASTTISASTVGSAVTSTSGTAARTLNAGQQTTISSGYSQSSRIIRAKSLSSQTSGTATASDIASGKTAWVNGTKLTGTKTDTTLPTFDSSSLILERGSSNYYGNGPEGMFGVYGTISVPSQINQGYQCLGNLYDGNLQSDNIKQGVSIFGVVGTYLGYSLSGTWELDARTVHENYYHNPAISASGLDYELQYGADGFYTGSTLKLDVSGLWGDGSTIIWSGYDYAWMGEIDGNSYPTAYITFNGSYNVSEDFYNAFIAIATQTSSGSGGGSGAPSILTSTVTINAFGSDPYGYSGNTDFYYTAFENGAIVAKHTSSNAANAVTLNNVVVNTHLTYNCIGGIALGPSSGASWVTDLTFTGSQMSQIFEITSTSARFSTYTDCCFEGTSQILLADSTTKNLSEISIGEKLITYNEQTGINEINEVTALGTAPVNHNTIIVLEDDTIIQMNKYHPLWTEDGWKSIVRHRNLPKLTEADKLMNNNGDYVAIKSIEEVEIDTTTYYTIKVANNNNFYVNGYLAQGKERD